MKGKSRNETEKKLSSSPEQGKSYILPIILLYIYQHRFVIEKAAINVQPWALMQALSGELLKAIQSYAENLNPSA